MPPHRTTTTPGGEPSLTLTLQTATWRNLTSRPKGSVTLAWPPPPLSKNCSPNFPNHCMRCSRTVREGIVPGLSGTAELTNSTWGPPRPTFERTSTINNAVQESRNHWTRQRGGSRVSRTLLPTPLDRVALYSDTNTPDAYWYGLQFAICFSTIDQSCSVIADSLEESFHT